jgi:hypothetical protein
MSPAELLTCLTYRPAQDTRLVAELERRDAATGVRDAGRRKRRAP